MSNWKVPLSDLNYGVEESAAVKRVLDSKWLSMGPEVEAFEQEFAEFIGVKHALAVANATVALHLIFIGLGIGPGDEVIQPALNFVAAANITIASGATPVFADITGLLEPTIDPSSIERLINNRTKAILVMHYGGYLCRMDNVRQLCKDRGLFLIEDACHAVGATHEGRAPESSGMWKAGSMGDAGAFSFFSNKNLAVGEGGMVTTNRDDVAEAVRRVRSHGMTTLTWDRERGHANTYDVAKHGYNYRLDEIRAALGREQLKKLTSGNAMRGECVTTYRSRLADVPHCALPFADYEGDSAFHLMPVLFQNTANRDTVTASLKAAGIQTSLHYPTITDFSAFQLYKEARVPVSRLFSSQVITLPLYATMTRDAVHIVCDQIGKALAN